jgi:hypothetical protein
MDSQKRLSVLKHMLARLTGEQSPEPVVSPVPAALPTPSPDPRERRLQLLRSMLSRLQGS